MRDPGITTSSGIIAEIKSKLPAIDVVGETVTLKRAGTVYKGLCPFHDEKTPSFNVNPSRGSFHCFGCQEGGNVYQFIQKVENLPFPEAVEWLARKMNFELHYEE